MNNPIQNMSKKDKKSLAIASAGIWIMVFYSIWFSFDYPIGLKILLSITDTMFWGIAILILGFETQTQKYRKLLLIMMMLGLLTTTIIHISKNYFFN